MKIIIRYKSGKTEYYSNVLSVIDFGEDATKGIAYIVQAPAKKGTLYKEEYVNKMDIKDFICDGEIVYRFEEVQNYDKRRRKNVRLPPLWERHFA